MRKSVLTAAGAALVAVAAGQNCISLAESTACSAFNASSISTDSQLTALYPFLQYVSNVEDFDRQLNQYVSQSYVNEHYGILFGCDNINLSNTSDYYARFTNSWLCNGIVQNSVDACGLSGQAVRPLCADSCASFAQSEAVIISSNQLCSPRNSNYDSQLRADFTNCALPADSLATTCIPGIENEPDNCGFGDNTMGLCDYCRSSTSNATDSCCYTSDTETRCEDVVLPSFSSIAVDFTSTASSPTATSTSSSAASSNDQHSGLSAGAIAGIIVGSILGALLLMALIIGVCILVRRRRREAGTSNFLNQPSPQRKGVTGGLYDAPPGSSQGYEVLPGGRVARMAALSGDDGGDYTATSDVYGDSPGSNEKTLEGGIGALKLERSPGAGDETNDSSNEYSSPEGVASGQSEQLPFFKDYYSNDDIHPGDKVAVLWAYQPRAGDEFELERGDMLKVIGIWDDGWATGVRINDRAEDYEGKHKMERDSGISNTIQQREETTPPPPGEIKAFPLVCICLPEAWKKTVEGDTSTEGSGPPTI